MSPKSRGLRGVVFAVSANHVGLKRAVAEILPEASWQRCYVHFLHNALDYLPRRADDDCSSPNCVGSTSGVTLRRSGGTWLPRKGNLAGSS
jgi:hypothetical protein